jgi:branched-chain amino acid transport system substrate-binding protein
MRTLSTQALWRKIGALATALAAVSTLIGAGPSGDPFTIDAILPLTGASAFAGQIHANALRMYELAANATGGIHGRPVHFEIHDDQSNSVTAVELTNQILARKPPVIIGSAYVAACAAEIPLVTNAGALEFCVSPGMTSRQRNVYASAIAITSIVPGEVKVFRDRGYTRIAVISTTDASGQAADDIVRAAMARPENKSVAIVAFEHFNPSDLSVNALASRIKAANPQGIVLDGVTGNAFGNVLRTLNDAGVNIPVIGSAANMNPSQLEQFSGFVPKELIFNSTLLEARNEVQDRGVRAAIDELNATYKRAGAEVLPESPFSWDPAKIIVAALRALGPNATGDQLIDYIANLHDFAASSGIYDFRIGDHHGLTDSALVFVKWVPAQKTFLPVTKPGGGPL